MFTCTARLLRGMLDSIATPCLLKAYGLARRNPPQLDVTICDFKLLIMTFSRGQAE
jgi:hypothetical protein